jgi:chloride channel, nucleotide-sensitive, 1A
MISFNFSDICWKNQESEEGFMIPWEKITVQAITQEPQRCVYFMIDVVWPGESHRNGETNGNSDDEGNGDDDDDASEESLAEITEFYLIPDTPDAVDEIYYIMTKYPAEAPIDEDSDEEGFLDGDQIEQMNIEDDDRFEDP